MKIIDFLFYCNIKWINRYTNSETVKAYAGSQTAITIAIWYMIWVVTIARLVVYFYFHSQLTAIPLLLIDLTAVPVYFVLKYFYVKKGRSILILENNIPIYNVSDKTAVIFVITTHITSLVLFILVPILLNIIG